MKIYPWGRHSPLQDQNMFMYELLRPEIISYFRSISPLIRTTGWIPFTFCKYSKLLWTPREIGGGGASKDTTCFRVRDDEQNIAAQARTTVLGRRVSNLLSQTAKRGSAWNGARFVHRTVNVNSRVSSTGCCQIYRVSNSRLLAGIDSQFASKSSRSFAQLTFEIKNINRPDKTSILLRW